ncbi:MAG: DsbA family protein [Proteobacteria bacterium]|nr:DsbA family protein [Pseudomonadota bacterium]
MRSIKLLSIMILFVLFPLSALAGGNSSIKGSYTTAVGQEFNYDGKTVEVLEFMSFYCDHCFEFERSIPVIKGNFPKKINWKIVPVYWGEGSSKPGEAYFLARDAGKGEEMIKAIFRANFIERKDIGNVEVLESIATKLGLGSDFGHKLRSGAKVYEADRALRMAGAYRIEETPTLIIAGNITTNAHASNHDLKVFRGNVITIIKSILE